MNNFNFWIVLVMCSLLVSFFLIKDDEQKELIKESESLRLKSEKKVSEYNKYYSYSRLYYKVFNRTHDSLYIDSARIYKLKSDTIYVEIQEVDNKLRTILTHFK